MTDSFIYARDPYTQEYVVLKLYDNGDSTYSLTRDFTADISIWPSAAKYGNNVSFAEAFGYTSDQVDAIKVLVDKLAGTSSYSGGTIANWQSGTATSGETGADLKSIGANDTKYKIHSLLVSIRNLTTSAIVTVRMYQQIDGVEDKVYEQNFVKGTSPSGIWIIDSSVGIYDILRLEVYSNTAADNGKEIYYNYMLETI